MSDLLVAGTSSEPFEHLPLALREVDAGGGPRVARAHVRKLGRWLETDDSKGVGWKGDGDDESTGHASGRHIALLLGKKQAGYSDDDVKHMRKVVSYVRRHLAQRPEGDVEDTRWRHSLMNWGHNPLK